MKFNGLNIIYLVLTFPHCAGDSRKTGKKSKISCIQLISRKLIPPPFQLLNLCMQISTTIECFLWFWPQKGAMQLEYIIGYIIIHPNTVYCDHSMTCVCLYCLFFTIPSFWFWLKLVTYFVIQMPYIKYRGTVGKLTNDTNR